MEKKAEMTDVMAQLDISYTWWDKLVSPFVWIKVRIQDKWHNFRCRCQRFKKGYCDQDVWEMRDWFIKTAKPMLREMSAKAWTYPDKIEEEQWRELLLEMADLLEVMDIWDDAAARKQAGIGEDDHSEAAEQRIWAEQEKAKERFFFLFNRWFYDMWY